MPLTVKSTCSIGLASEFVPSIDTYCCLLEWYLIVFITNTQNFFNDWLMNTKYITCLKQAYFSHNSIGLGLYDVKISLHRPALLSETIALQGISTRANQLSQSHRVLVQIGLSLVSILNKQREYSGNAANQLTNFANVGALKQFYAHHGYSLVI